MPKIQSKLENQSTAFFVIYFYSLDSYGMRIVLCLAAATVQTMGFKLDPKVCIAPTKGQLQLYFLLSYVALPVIKFVHQQC